MLLGSITSANNQQKYMNDITEHTLKNGLKVIIKEDHSAPIFAQALFYRIGSKNDKELLTGAAHYLEHMQFNGTASHPKGTITRGIEERGGTFNAATGKDYTFYYETLPSGLDNLRFTMELEADRMRNSIINPTEAIREKQVVLAELEGGENNPATILYKKMLKNIYPEHAYGDPIIGWRDDLDRLDAKNLKEHYDNYYQPDNAVLILVGDVDAKQSLKMAEETFGQIPKSNKEFPLFAKRTESKEQAGEKEIIVDFPTERKIFALMCKSPGFQEKDFLPLNVLSAILTHGSLSYLEKALVDTGKASYVASSAQHAIDPFIFMVLAMTSTDGDLEDIEKTINSQIEQIRKQGVSAEELERVKAKTETSFLFEIEDPSELAAQMGIFELMAGDWRKTFSWADDIRKVSVDDVNRVARQYLSAENCYVGKLYQHDKVSQAKSNEQIVSITDKQEHLTNQNEKGIKAEEIKLDNGIKVILRYNPNNPVISVHGSMDAGGMYGDITSSLVAMMLDRGSSEHSRDQLARELESIGADIDFSPGDEFINIEAQGRAKDYDQVFSLLAEQLREPIFSTEELQKLKTQLLSQLEQNKDNANYLGRSALYRSIYPEGHPYYEEPLDKQAKYLQETQQETLKKFHQLYYQPQNLILSISGDFEQDKLLQSLKEHLGDWENTHPLGNYMHCNASKEMYELYGADPDVCYFNGKHIIELNLPNKQVIEVPGKTQAVIYMGHYGGLKRSDEDFYAVTIANDILGGGSSLASRLGQKVREEAGLVYGIHSNFRASRGAGPFLIKMGVAPDKIDQAIKLTQEELKEFLNGNITDEELSRAKNFRKGAFISHNLVSNVNVSSSLNLYALLGIDLDTINDYPDKIEAVTKEDVKRVIAKYLHPDKLQIIVVKPPAVHK